MKFLHIKMFNNWVENNNLSEKGVSFYNGGG
jgi:hypothetical protein